MYQKNDQEDEVEEREDSVPNGWQTPGQSQHQLKDIVHVAGEAPKATV